MSLSEKGVDTLDLARSVRLAPVPVYLIMLGAASFFTMMYGILASVYRIEEAGLNPLQLVLVAYESAKSSWASSSPARS